MDIHSLLLSLMLLATLTIQKIEDTYHLPIHLFCRVVLHLAYMVMAVRHQELRYIAECHRRMLRPAWLKVP